HVHVCRCGGLVTEEVLLRRQGRLTSPGIYGVDCFGGRPLHPKSQRTVQSFPGPGPKIQVSSEGGTDPVWKRSGGELFYRNGDSMIAVCISTAPILKVGRPQELWLGRYSHGMSSSCGAPGLTSSNYDVTADGKHFLMIKDDDQDRARSTQIIVVQGW